ncbi:hypothetical protein, partial [Pseudomonas sp. NW5]|uniref:hypothetical protein n=1 Tax=Pseudomonas sp. NW5 TaxID=2934934 RepID=UPI00202138B5
IDNSTSQPWRHDSNQRASGVPGAVHNETLEVVELGGDSLILKSQAQRSGEIKFSLFRDDDGDGLWTEIAEGEAQDAFVTVDCQIDLVGILEAGLLQPADLLIA